MIRLLLRLLTCVVLVGTAAHAALPSAGNFSQTNLVAWCIVPFDSRRRGPEERAAMLEQLGIHRLAYDWRSEHVPTFDAEVAALAKRHIELTAWWFPAALNAEARAILDCLARHHLSPQLWVTLGTEPEGDPARLDKKIHGAVDALAPICAEAAKLGSTVGLYNHLGWFGEPANQLTILERLRARGHTNAGIVYNFHHGHAHIERFPELLRQMQPHLLAVNLNGMLRDGDKTGKKIIPVGTGEQELEMIRALRDSGWKGPIGILGHTEEDAEVKLRKELDGLNRLIPQLDAPRQPKPGRPTQANNAPGSTLATAPGASRAPGEPAISGRDPGVQGEQDWVDNRWQHTDVGPSLASILPTPSGAIAKALSLKVGDNAEGGVAYDTANGAFRAAWTGGFLRVSPSRFGLIDAPNIDGQVQHTFAAGPGWLGPALRFTGHHLQGRRVVLEFDIGGTRVLETPWLKTIDGLSLFTRSLDIGPATQELLWAAATPTLTAGAARWVVTRDTRGARAELATGPNRLVAVLLGGNGEFRSDDAGRLRVAFSPQADSRRATLVLWQGPAEQVSRVNAAAATFGTTEDVRGLIAPGPSRWPALSTIGERGSDTDFLAVDTLTAPYDNPWKALLFFAGVDLSSDQVLYACTIHGDVWRVTGINESLGRLEWKRYATGLFQPLGLKVRNDVVYVLGRDRITRLHDENNDGEADFYESFCDRIETSTGGHDYVTCLEQDTAGNFYYVDPKGVHRVSPDGRRAETLASGWRNPNGLGVSPDGRIVTVAPQQGEWTPSSVITEIRPGGFYGYRGPKVTPDRPLGYDPHLCWIPHSVDNSSGSQVWLPEGAWGPLGGHFLHLLWGRAGLMLVLRDATGAVPQGAVVPLPAKFLSGPNRATYNPRDGCLYVAGSTGWQTSARKDGAIQRVRFTNKPVALPIDWQAEPDALVIRFSQALDRSTAEDPGSYALKQWNYRYAASYGSKDWSVVDPTKEGRDPVEVKSAHLLPDGRSVRLDVPGLRPVMQMELKYNVDAANGGKPLRGQLWLTLNRVEK